MPELSEYRDAVAAVIRPAFDEWLFRMHGTVTSCGHETEAEGIADALLASDAIARIVADARAEAGDGAGGEGVF